MNSKTILFKFSLIHIILICFTHTVLSQTLVWRTLPNSPVTNGFRFEDVFFANPEVGWVCEISGRLYKTTDGGNSWVLQIANSAFPFRSLGFSDTLNGYAGLYYRTGSLTSPLIRTSDGGSSWFNVEDIPAPIPAGICGISIVNSLVMYGVGKIDGPASVVKTTDGGASWQSFDMTGIASRLVDCHFFTADSGFVVGALGPFNSGRDIVLFTSNGGANWENKFTSFIESGYESCWKINFINDMNSVISLNHVRDSLSFLKSTDGGQTWQRKAFQISSGYFTQGIGFINENTGWLGGDAYFTYGTTDGGLTWKPNTVGENINRIRFLNDTLGYSVGTRVYKYSRDSTTGIESNSNIIPKVFLLEQNYPNPFNPGTKFKFEVPNESMVKISIIDILGKEVNVLLNDYFSGGVYQAAWDGRDSNGNSVASGLYFYRMEAKDFSVTRKMMLLR